MKLTDIQYNKLKDLLSSAKISKDKEYEELKETAPGVYKTKGYVGGHHKMTYYSLDNTELKKFVSELVNQDENNIVTMHKIQYSPNAKTKAHYDKSTFTLVIMLESIELEGGEFYINNKFVPFENKKEYITYNGGTDMHEVREIKNGYREVAVFWWFDETKHLKTNSII